MSPSLLLRNTLSRKSELVSDAQPSDVLLTDMRCANDGQRLASGESKMPE
jgi:hypothetical protein